MTFKHLTRCILAACVVFSVSPVMAQDMTAKDKIAERDLTELKRLLPGIYTNEEQVYFQTNLGLPEDEHVERIEIIVTRKGSSFSSSITWPDGQKIEARHDYRVRNGAIQADAIRFGRVDCSRTVVREFDSFHADGCDGELTVTPKGLILTNGQGTYHLRRARTFKCWMSPRKTDGSYAFYNDLVLHDQGGRVWVDATADHPRVGLKLRNVNWPAGVNRDSMVLYTYQGQDEDYSPSFVWSDPDAERLALNSRWLQASCTQGEETYTPTLTASGSERP